MFCGDYLSSFVSNLAPSNIDIKVWLHGEEEVLFVGPAIFYTKLLSIKRQTRGSVICYGMVMVSFVPYDNLFL